MDLKLHDIVEMKKEHPCGCGHEVMAPRRKLEKSIKRMITEEESI